MNRGVFFLFLLFLTVSCGLSPEELAALRLSKAQQLYQEKNYNEAKLVLDTLIQEHADQIEPHTRAKDLMRNILIDEQERSLKFVDSLMNIKENEMKPMMKNFSISEEYNGKKVLTHKYQQTHNSYNRTYLKACLDLNGEFYLASYYCGSYHIRHNQIKVYNNSISTFSEEVPFDGFENRHFEDGDYKWEVVNYKNGKDNGIVDYISRNCSQPLKVQFIGEKTAYVMMESYDKEAIRDAYEISFILKELARLKSEKKNIQLALSKLR